MAKKKTIQKINRKTTFSKLEDVVLTKSKLLLALEKAIQPVEKPRPVSKKIKTSAKKNSKLLQNFFNWFSVFLTAFFIVIAILYTYNLDFLSSFLSNTLGTIFGAFCGLFFVLWVDKQERDVENEQLAKEKDKNQNKVLEILIDDIRSNQSILQDHDIKNSSDVLFLQQNLKVEGWRIFSEGGELRDISNLEILRDLADIFQKTHSLIDLLELKTEENAGKIHYRSISSLAINTITENIFTELSSLSKSFLDKTAQE